MLFKFKSYKATAWSTNTIYLSKISVIVLSMKQRHTSPNEHLSQQYAANIPENKKKYQLCKRETVSNQPIIYGTI